MRFMSNIKIKPILTQQCLSVVDIDPQFTQQCALLVTDVGSTVVHWRLPTIGPPDSPTVGHRRLTDVECMLRVCVLHIIYKRYTGNLWNKHNLVGPILLQYIKIKNAT